MQFLVCSYDGDDEAALDRRLAVRADHLALGDVLKAQGHLLMAVALLDGDDRMVGSAMVVEFASRAELDRWLAVEPYVVGDVWRRVEVTPCRVGPSFGVN